MIIMGGVLVLLFFLHCWLSDSARKEKEKKKEEDYKRKCALEERNAYLRQRRRDYYNNVYLKSDEWRHKREMVLNRDNWVCVHCGAPATQVHHTRYAKRRIGKEPIEWLESVCKDCHEGIHDEELLMDDAP